MKRIIFIKKINIVSADLCYVLLSDGTCFEAHDEWILGEENDLVYYDDERYHLYFIKYNDYRGYRIVEKFNKTGEFDPMFFVYPEFPKYRKRLVTRVVKFPNDVFVALDDEIFHHTNGRIHAYWTFVEKGQHVLESLDGTKVLPMPLGIDCPHVQYLLTWDDPFAAC